MSTNKSDKISGKMVIVSANGKSTGKKNLMHRLLSDQNHLFSDRHIVNPSFMVGKKIISRNEKKVEITIATETSDIALGPPKTEARHYKQADLFLLVFDVTDPTSIEELPKKLEEIKKIAPGKPIFLVGSKWDSILNSKNQSENVYRPTDDFCTQNGLTYCGLVSSKTGRNIKRLRETVLDKIVSIKSSSQHSHKDTATSGKSGTTGIYRKESQKLRQEARSTDMSNRPEEMNVQRGKISNRILIMSATDKPVGKSNLVNRLTDKDFSEQYEKGVGLEYAKASMTHGEQDVDMTIAEFASDERSDTNPYRLKAQQYLLVFDLTDKESLDGLHKRVKNIKEIAPNAPILLVGTKSDLTDKITVTEQNVNSFCQQNGIQTQHYFMVSSKANEGIDALKSTILTNAVDPNICPPLSTQATAQRSEKHPEPSQTGVFRRSTNQYSHPPKTADDIARNLEQLSAQRTLKKGGKKDRYARAIDAIKAEVEAKDSPSDSFGSRGAFDKNESIKEINKNINKLQWTMGSMLNTAVNFLLAISIVGTIAGLLYDCCKSANNPTKGNPFLFVNQGLKQKVETEVAPHIHSLKPGK